MSAQYQSHNFRRFASAWGARRKCCRKVCNESSRFRQVIALACMWCASKNRFPRLSNGSRTLHTSVSIFLFPRESSVVGRSGIWWRRVGLLRERRVVLLHATLQTVAPLPIIYVDRKVERLLVVLDAFAVSAAVLRCAESLPVPITKAALAHSGGLPRVW